MKFSSYKYFIKSDLYRYSGDSFILSFIYHFLLSPGFVYSFWMRTCLYLSCHPFLRIFLPLAWLLLIHYEHKFGISISYKTQIDRGLLIGHFGGIVVNQHVVIGKNCNLSNQVTLGKSNRGSYKGYPTIGDNVYIGPGAKVIGNVKVGSNAAIGANCVVTKDVPESGVVVGVPGKVISLDGSAGYINKSIMKAKHFLDLR